jgi:hypothetical protein
VGRKQLHKYQLRCWVEPDNYDRLKSIALAMGYTYSGEGSIGPLLDAIAKKEMILVPAKKILDDCDY